MEIPEEFRIRKPKQQSDPIPDLIPAYGTRTKTKPVSPEAQVVIDWQQKKTPENAAKMLSSVRPVLEHGLRRYAPAHVDSPLLMSHSKLLALNALERYDPAQSQVDTFLMSHLQRLQRLAVQQGNVISVPERVLLDRQAVDRASAELEDQLGRLPNTAELSDYMGMPIKRIAHIRKARLPLSEGQATLVDSEGNPVAPAVEQAPTHAAAEFVYDSLDNPRDRLILELGLGLHGQPKLNVAEIARRLGITASAVSQRTSKIQQQINEMEDFEILR